MPLLKGYDLEGYIDGTNECPLHLTSNNEPNPAYFSWQKQDQILLGWLLSSLLETVLAQVVGLGSSRSTWLALDKHFASKSRARILQIRRELQPIRKGNQTMAEYFLHAKTLADSLVAVGQPILDSDLQQMILNELDSTYDAIVTTLATIVDVVVMDDIHAHLLAFDMRVEAQSLAVEHPVANVAVYRHNISLKFGSMQNSPRSNYGNQNRNCI
ncbi:hypothetical protein GIB67_020359 [Kingdonia uniflora]|uniref:Retrovirus-related Pol polyprotein from transposon RE1 n=1 Tax=Kingdonia uniflora TaxID=39325 RepID=A0A7J7LRJ8_9MAGN|nr:hypothetical protein GIB67_020359 [Kingdonia uniflora]